MKLIFLIFFLIINYSFAIEWKIKESPHFIIYYEGKWLPGPLLLESEKIFFNIRLNISIFSPWMTKYKTKIYIYENQEKYLKGEFNPPQWSKGLAFFDKKCIVVYDMGDIQKLKATISHELTHLYFESFFSENLKYPPHWLNEGLAVFMEDMSYDGEGPWKTALKYSDKNIFINFKNFFETDVDKLSNSQEIANWYLQAYGIVVYLYRPQTRLAFKKFCDFQREKDKLEENLWKAYRIKDITEFENKWKNWLKEIDKENNQMIFKNYPSASFNNFKLIEFKPINKNK